MTRIRHVAVIDVGKTNAKVALVDLDELREVDVDETRNTVRPGEPYPHHDTEALWSFVLASLRRLNAGHEVAAITATTHGASAVLVGADGRLVTPMLDYEHDGPDSVADEYDALRPDFAESGSPRLPRGFNLGAQLHWLLRTRPGLHQQLAYVVTYPQYWVGRLTGQWCTEVTSLGCHTDLWLPREARLSGLVERLGLEGKVAPVRRAGDRIGTILPGVAQETGLPPGTPVYCGIHDSNASLYPHLLQRDGPFAVLSTGTWVITMAVGGDPGRLDPSRDTLMNVNAFGEAVPSARFMGGREFETVLGEEPADPSPEAVAEVLRRGVLLSPAVVPTSGPFQGRQPRWSEPEAGLADGERVAAVSFYLAMMAVTCLELTGAQGPVVVEGPFARNDPFLDLVAAAGGRSVLTSTGSVTGTSIGAALLAATDVPAMDQMVAHALPEGAYRQDLARYAERWRRFAA
jgi:sugar (pentulose or hexulose) kinase